MYTSRIVDGCTDATSIAQLFDLKYCTLYSSVPFDAAEMHNLLTEIGAMVSADGGLSRSDHFICTGDKLATLGRIHLHKSDGAGAVSQQTTSFMLVPIWHVLLLFCSLA